MGDSGHNCITYFIMCQEVSGRVLTRTLELLFKGQQPVGKHLALRLKNASFNENERFTLEQLQDGERTLQDLDVSILFRAIQRTCGLVNPSHAVWHTENLKIHKSFLLEHYLYQLKALRNEAVHDCRYFLRNMNCNEFRERKENLAKLLVRIINNVGRKARISQHETHSWKSQVQDDISAIARSTIIIHSELSASTLVTPHSGTINAGASDSRKTRSDSVDAKPDMFLFFKKESEEEIRSRLEREDLEEDLYIEAWNERLPPETWTSKLCKWFSLIVGSWSFSALGIACYLYYART